MYEIQVEIDFYDKDKEKTRKVWTSICPSYTCIPYRFITKNEAEKMARMCYGSIGTPYRVV